MISSMIFFPEREFSFQPADFGLKAEDIFLFTEDKIKLHGFWLPAGDSKTALLFFHGNAGNISIRLPKAAEWVKRGVSVFLIDYRGYGKSAGRIGSEEDLHRDARAAFRWLNEEKKRAASQTILYGESIGAVPAIQLGTEHSFKTVILEGAFTSLKAIAQMHYGFAPDFLIQGFRMPNDERIGKIKSPLFVLHGTDDEISPLSMGRELFEQAPDPKEFFAVQGGTHNDLDSAAGEEFYEKPFQFAMKERSR